VQRDRRLRAELMQSDLVATFPAGAYNTKADIEEAMQSTHDMLLRELGDRRRSGVTWMVYEDEGRWMAIREFRYEPPDFQGLREWLEATPGSVLVVAMAAAEPGAGDGAAPQP
jgi:hypothetical protein